MIDVYEDGGHSARNLKRPGIQRLIEDARAKRFDVAIVHKLDRLTRRQYHLWLLLDEVLIPNGVDFVSVTEGFDTSTASGKLVLSVLGSVAQWERDIISERTREVQKRMKERGLCYAQVPIGYDNVNGRLVPNPREQKIIAEARRFKREGKALRDIRQSLKEMGYLNRKGNGFSLSVLSRMVAGG